MLKKSRFKEKDKKKKEKRVKRFRKKVCKFCLEKTLLIDYKDIGRLQRCVTEKGKIIPRRISGSCSRHQRDLAAAVHRAREVALLPYTVL